MSEPSASRVWWIAGGSAALVVVLVIVALARDPVKLDASTPGGAVQVYLQAIADEDYEMALEMIHPDSREGCLPADLAFTHRADPFSATLGDTDISDRSAFVEVTITYAGSPGPFDPGQGGFNQLFTLEEFDGQWLITGEPWPYFMWRCDE